METTLQFQLKIIDFYTTFEYLLSYRSSDYIELNPHTYTPNSTVYCPFHENRDTKAAKLYPKDDGNPCEKLYCFAENKIYYPHSLLSPPRNLIDKTILYKFKSIIPYDPLWVFSAIWNHLPDRDKKYWMSENPDIVINGNRHNFDHLYKSYRVGEKDLFSILTELDNK